MEWGRILSTFVGSIPAIVIVGGLLLRLDRRFIVWSIEHEILVDWWIKQHPGEKFPTRTKR